MWIKDKLLSKLCLDTSLNGYINFNPLMIIELNYVYKVNDTNYHYGKKT